jgi:hypothetical protein
MSYFYQIKRFKTEEEKTNFINQRLSELKNDELVELGYNTDITVYDKFLNEKSKLIAIIDFDHKKNTASIGSFNIDDDSIYNYLIDSIQEAKNPYDAVFYAIHNYFKTDTKSSRVGKKRERIYRHLSMPKDKSISIKLISKKKVALCSEMAAVAHNMFRFLNIDSDFVMSGAVDNHLHTYDVIYPEGRRRYAVLYDPTMQLLQWNHPVMFKLDETKRRELFTNKNVAVTNRDAIKAYNSLLKLTIVQSEDFKINYAIFKDTYKETLIKYSEESSTKKLVLKRER